MLMDCHAVASAVPLTGGTFPLTSSSPTSSWKPSWVSSFVSPHCSSPAIASSPYNLNSTFDLLLHAIDVKG